MGFAFDWYRIFRVWRGWGKILTFLGDAVFSLLALSILVIFLQRANWLSFRLYSFAGVIVGLLLYMRFLSKIVTRLAMGVFRSFEIFARLLINAANIAFNVLRWLMWPFYAIMRWISLLFYRFSEVVFLGTAKAGRHKAGDWWNRHFPPRTKG